MVVLPVFTGTPDGGPANIHMDTRWWSCQYSHGHVMVFLPEFTWTPDGAPATHSQPPPTYVIRLLPRILRIPVSYTV